MCFINFDFQNPIKMNLKTMQQIVVGIASMLLLPSMQAQEMSDSLCVTNNTYITSSNAAQYVVL